MALRTLSICSGIGGIDLALRSLGVARTVLYVEREAFCAAVLAAQAEAGALDQAPVWSDLRTLRAGRLRGRVDLVAGGIPCQPHSVAGKRLGLADERDLIHETLRVLDECGAPLLFLENVARFLRSGAPQLLGALAERGFDAEWSLLSASEVGASHKRERFFLLAHRGADGQQLLRAALDAAGWHAPRHEPDGCGARVADANGDADGTRSPLDGDRLDLEPELTPALRASWPPGPGDLDAWREWISAGGPEPCVRRGAHGVPDRVDRIRALGNAVVPQQVALAWLVLARRATMPAWRKC